MNNWKHWVAGSIVTMAAFLLPNMAQAADNGIVTYEETPEGIIITGAVDEEWYLSPNDVILPDTINGKPVIEIADGAFSAWGKYDVAAWDSFRLPSTVKKIGDEAFISVPVPNLELPSGIKEIGNYAFYRSLSDVGNLDLPDSLEVIGESNFMHAGIETLVLHEGLKKIGESAFMGNQIDELNLPETLETLDHSAFSSNEITTVIIPETLDFLGDYVFEYNQVSTFDLGNLTNVPYGMFYGNDISEFEGEVFISIPQSVETIHGYAFGEWVGEVSGLNFKGSVIENNSFSDMQFKDGAIFDIDDNLNEMGHNAFTGIYLHSPEVDILLENIKFDGISQFYYSDLHVNSISISSEQVPYTLFGYSPITAESIVIDATVLDGNVFDNARIHSESIKIKGDIVGGYLFNYATIGRSSVIVNAEHLNQGLFYSAKFEGAADVVVETNTTESYIFYGVNGVVNSLRFSSVTPFISDWGRDGGTVIYNTDLSILEDLDVSLAYADNNYGNTIIVGGDVKFTTNMIGGSFLTNSNLKAGGSITFEGDNSEYIEEVGYHPTIFNDLTLDAGGDIKLSVPVTRQAIKTSEINASGTITFDSRSIDEFGITQTTIVGNKIVFDIPDNISFRGIDEVTLKSNEEIVLNPSVVANQAFYALRVDAPSLIFGEDVTYAKKMEEYELDGLFYGLTMNEESSIEFNSYEIPAHALYPAFGLPESTILGKIVVGDNVRVIGDHAFDAPFNQKTVDLNYATQIGRHVFGDNDTMERLIIRAGDAVINSHAYFPERYGRNGTATEDPKDFVVMGCYGTMVDEFADIRGYSFETIADCKTYYVDGYNPPDDDFRPGTPVITHTGTNPSPVPVDVTVTYESEDTLNQFRVNYGKWTTYTGTFTIYGDVFIQARSIADDGWVSNYGQLDLNWMEVPGSHPGYPLTPPGEQPPVGEEPTPYPENPGVFPPDPDNPGDGGTDPEGPGDGTTDPEGPSCVVNDISRYVYVAELMKRDPHVTNAIQKVAEMDDTCADKQALEDRMTVVVEWIAERDYQLFKDIVHRNLKWAQSFEREPYLTALDASEDLREEDQQEVDAAKQAIYDAMTQKQIDAAVKAANTQVGYAERYKRDPYLTRAVDAIDKVPYGSERDALHARLDAVLDAVSASLEAGKVTAATAAVEKAEGGQSIFLIDEAQALVTALKDSDEKTALQDRLDAIELTDEMLFAYELKNDILALEVAEERTLFDASFDATKAYAERVTSTNLAKAEAALAALAPYAETHQELYERLGQYLADVKAKIAEDAMYARAENVIALAERYKRQTYIDKAQAEIDLLPEGERRDALQTRLDAIEL